MAQRFPKLTTDEMTPAQREVAAEITAGPRGVVRGPFIAWIHHPELAHRLQALGEQLRWKATLPPQLIELAVLVCARRWSCQHEWFMHEKLAREAKLDPRIIDAIATNEKPQNLSPEQAAVYDFCKDLHASGRASDAAFEAVRGRFGLEGALELVALSGYYSLMAMVLNTAGMPLPGGAPPPLK
ncbi:MAG: 4-carboxymuconolactone decarboxylase [Betaproteobacteria bacterium]|jgi:4-carboxymuconolactone decarboxylase|nr:4-carboxymuconolactone decarboxylase [Betaproteobacteria bacterium]